MNSSKILGRHPDFPECEVGFDPELNFYRTIPYPTEADLEQFYTAEYRDVRKESPNREYVAFMRHRANVQSRFILESTGRDQFQSVMDIGCGCGELLNALQPHAEKLHGFETDQIMAAHAHDNKLSASIEIRNEHYSPLSHPFKCDLIAMSHVLEHIPNPVRFLADLKQNTLTPGGAIFLEVPNEPEIWVNAQINWQRRGLGHINYFTEQALENILLEAGFVNPVSRECGRLVRKHMSASKPSNSIFQRVKRRIMRRLPTRPVIPDYDAEGGSEPRIYLQVVATTPLI